MMMGDRKKYVTQILGDDKKEGEGESPLHAIANELIEAVHSHDVEAVVSCLKSAYAHCGSDGQTEGG